MDTLLIIDGNSLINRAFYALPWLSTKDGKPSNAVFGFTSMLIKAIGDFAPKYVAVAFDLPAPTFRHLRYSGYKATRKPMPDDLAQQMPMLKELLSAMDIKILEKAGYEADDIIGTAARLSGDTVIITGDRDALQLIDAKTKVAITRKGITEIGLYDEAALADEWGLKPEGIIEYKALAGDASDNIPGVAGVGDKTAKTLVRDFGGLDGIYARIDEIGGKLKEKLLLGKDSAYLSRELATIDRYAPIDFAIEDCELKFPFAPSVRAIFEEYNFRSLLKRDDLFAEGGETGEKFPQCEIVRAERPTDVIPTDKFAFICGEEICFAPSAEKQYEIPISRDLLGGVREDEVITHFGEVFASRSAEKIVYDAKAVKKHFRGFGAELNDYFDVRLAQYLLEGAATAEKAEDFMRESGAENGFAAAMFYKAERQREALKNAGMEKLYYEVELPLVDLLFRMENAGFKLDAGRLDFTGEEYAARIDALSAQIYEKCGRTFNINSPKQLAKVLFEELEIPYPKRSKTYSTGAEILEQLADEYPVASDILEYRFLTKLNGTYIEGFKKLMDKNGMVHTEFKQMLTTTGRLSSAEPNLQNIPIREEEGRKLRKLFIPSAPDRCLIGADYSQIELRLLAHLSGDETMIAAFNSGDDIHAQTAAEIYGVPLKSVTPEMRRGAKAINFGIIYGMSDFGLAKTLKISVAAARGFINKYFEKFGRVKQYLDSLVASAYETGEAVTLFGRKRRIPELKSSNRVTRQFGERAAMNTPLQGSAADVIKIAMLKVDEMLRGTDSRLILQVHDELIVDAADSEAEKVSEILREGMESAVKLSVPLTVSVGMGKNWYDCK